ncbi:MAG TPA: right-handed parallel beta-helix repeat-containing protein [Planctomycetaceae bacterium]|nr:right-handed parallel beta-helix repeat-containing protein [Planctomycetaceae bacterium]
MLSIEFWGGGVYGQGPVQDRSILPVEMFPFFKMDDSLFFSDLRFFPTVEGTFGGNVGFGYRYYSKTWDRVFGISGWYDADGTRDDYYQQLGLSLETYAGPFDFRTNFYLPVGQTDRTNSLALVNNSTHFVGSNAAYDQIETFTAAMRGLDMEAGVGIPGQFARQHAMRVYGGWYYYSDDQGDNILGASARLQANIASGLDSSVQITNDNFFNTRAFFSVSWTFGPLRRSDLAESTTADRLGEHVTRNYTVLAPTRTRLDSDVVAIDPQTGTPYTFAHVDSSAAAGGNGTVNSPFQTIAQAQAANDDIVFVHANSVFTGSAAQITMSPGQSILGQGPGVQHTIDVVGLGAIALPAAVTGSSLPVLQSASGTAVVLASNTIFSGFTISSPSASGIYGNGVSNAMIANVTVNHAGTDGIQLSNSSNTILLNNVNVNNSAGDGLAILGGSANVTFSGQLASNSGHDLNISNTSGGTLNMDNALFTGSGSQGILLQNNTGTIDFNNLTVSNTAGRAIDIEGGAGTVQFGGTTTVSGAAGTSVNIENLLSTGTVTFDNLAINNRQGVGLSVDGSAGTVTVNGTTTINNQGAATASALSITNSSAAVTFNGAVDVVNATGNPGVNLQNNSGTTTFSELNVSSTNGTGLFANNGGTLDISSTANGTSGGTITATNGTAVDLENTTLNVNLESVSSSGASVGMKLVNTGGTFFVFGASSGTAGSGGTIQGAGTGVQLQNAGEVGLVLMNLNSNGVGIQAQNTAYLALGGVQITNSTSYGIDALDVKDLSVANSTFSGNGAANIRFRADQLSVYTLGTSSNSFTSASADNILVQSLAGSEGATLNFTSQSDTFKNSQNGTAGINMTWNGTLSGTITGDTFTGSGGSNTGVRIDNLSTTQITAVAIESNSFTANGGNDTGFQVITAGPSNLTVTGNGVQFGATDGVGYRFSLGPAASLDLANNYVIDSAGGATGVLFDSVTGPGSLSINGNSVDLTNHGNGIIFSSVTAPVVSGMTYTVDLSGTTNNVIQGATTAFSAPAGTSGTILVNGTVVP